MVSTLNLIASYDTEGLACFQSAHIRSYGRLTATKYHVSHLMDVCKFVPAYPNARPIALSNMTLQACNNHDPRQSCTTTCLSWITVHPCFRHTVLSGWHYGDGKYRHTPTARQTLFSVYWRGVLYQSQWRAWMAQTANVDLSLANTALRGLSLVRC